MARAAERVPAGTPERSNSHSTCGGTWLHFARETGCGLIAEGIERDGERRVLRRLGVSFGQGYLLGRPAPVEDWVGGARS